MRLLSECGAGQAASTSGLANGNDSTIVIAAEQQQHQQGNGVSPLYVSNAQARGCAFCFSSPLWYCTSFASLLSLPVTGFACAGACHRPAKQGALLLGCTAWGQASASHHRMGVADVGGGGGHAAARRDGEGDMGAKYAKRSSGARRSLQRLFPALFAPSLPVTTRRAHPPVPRPLREFLPVHHAPAPPFPEKNRAGRADMEVVRSAWATGRQATAQHAPRMYLLASG